MAAYYGNGCVIPGTIEQHTEKKICPKCNKKFKSTMTEQIAGFREMSDSECPHCGYVIESSMGWDFHNSKF